MKYIFLMLVLTMGLAFNASSGLATMGAHEQIHQTEEDTCPCGTDEDGECLPCEPDSEF